MNLRMRLCRPLLCVATGLAGLGAWLPGLLSDAFASDVRGAVLALIGI